MKRRLGLCVLFSYALLAQSQLPQLDPLKALPIGQLAERARQITFTGRAVPPNSQKLLKELTHEFPLSLEREYARFVNKALIVRNTSVVDDATFQYDPFTDDPQAPRGPWSFPNLLRTALSGYDPRKIDGEVQAKIATDGSPQLGSVWKKVDKEEHLNTIPLRLLAVVNRLDLARLVVHPGSAPGAAICPKGKLCGAEIHFVYAGMIDPNATGTEDTKPYLMLILEFVMPPLSKAEFQQFTWKWMAQYVRPGDFNSVADMDGLLKQLMQCWAYGPRSARIRLDAHEGNWMFLQYAVTAHGLVRTPLNQEPNIDNIQSTCVGVDSPVGKYVEKYHADILRSDYDFYHPPVIGEAPKPADCAGGVSAPQRCAAILDQDKKKVLTLPPKLVRPSQVTDATRFSLSLNSCTGCHSFETRPVEQSGLDMIEPFDQVRYRRKGEVSSMSRFLTGGEDGEPHLYDTWQVQPPLAPNCGPDAESKNYNDLVRRAVFHLVVIGLPTMMAPVPGLDGKLDQIWSTALNEHGITAWQPH